MCPKSHCSKNSHIEFDLANLPSYTGLWKLITKYAPNLRNQVWRGYF